MASSNPHGDDEGMPLRQGAGSTELATDSTDPDLLRALLQRARERLSFYEGFDRVIAENVRRSGELMLETLSVREQVAAGAGLGDPRERERVTACLGEIDAGLVALRGQLDVLATQVAELRTSLQPGIEPLTPAPAAPLRAPNPVAAVTKATAAPAWDSPQVVEVIAHAVPKAATALSLQRHLGALDQVAGVEAREFAEGVLRLQVTARQPLAGTDLTAWTEGGPVTVLQQGPHVIEITLQP